MRATPIARVCAALCAAVSAHLLPERAGADITGAHTLEALGCEAEVIAVGRLLAWSTEKGEGAQLYEHCLLEVTEPIKGSPPRQLPFTYIHWNRHDAAPWRQHRVELLVALRHAPKAYGDEHRDWLVPITPTDPFSIFNLRKPPDDLFDRTGHHVTDRNEILSILRHWANSGVTNTLHRDASVDSEAFQQLYSGSIVWLFVPADENSRHEIVAQAHSPELWERAEAAAELWKFPGRDTEDLLRALLDDTAEPEMASLLGNTPDYNVAVFRVRQAAAQSLKKLGITPPDLPMQRITTPDERRRIREAYWTRVFQQKLPPGWRLTAVTDGPSRSVAPFPGGPMDDVSIIIVELENGERREKLMLVPVEWPPDDYPACRALGVRGPENQGARIYFCEATMPAAIQAEFIDFYKLVKSYRLEHLWGTQL